MEQLQTNPPVDDSSMLWWLQIAADNAVFGQTGPKVGSFDAGYGSSQMVRLIGKRRLNVLFDVVHKT